MYNVSAVNGRLMDLAHLLQQILLISAVLEAQTFTYRSSTRVKPADQASLQGLQEVPISAHLKIFSIKPDSQVVAATRV